MTTAFALDDSQWRAVEATDRHVLVAAGAGTGKTNTVVGRILYLLGVEVRGRRIASPCTLNEIAAITFTNAAAADLKRKVRDALRSVGRRAEAAQVDTARIGTIHGFAGDLLREFALRGDRAPGTAILMEGESAVVVGEAVRDTLIAAVEEQSVEGLDLLLGEWTLVEVQGWVRRLLGESDRLRGYARARESLPERERTLVDLGLRTLELLERRLEEAGTTDFDRMLVAARDLLRVPGICRVVQRRVRTLVVDEFQDVDPVQKDIAYLLGEPASGRRDTTRLMLVGDPKQSIYRFRRADVTVWTSVERDFREPALGMVVPLEVNYRSVGPLVGFVEQVIGPILDAPLSGDRRQDFEVGFQATTAHRAEDEPSDRAVELLLVHIPEGEKLATAERRRREAAAIAGRMLELGDGGTRWGEMAVLLASWGDLETYQSALRTAGIPTYALAQTGFYGRQEVVDTLVALEAIRDPRDDVALFGFLRSPFVGLRDETLLQIARQAQPPYWDRIGRVRVGEATLLEAGRSLLRELVEFRDRIGTAELIERLLLRSGYLAHLALLEGDGPQRLANLRKLVRMARGMAHLGVAEFVRMIRDARARKDREGDARLYSESDDVVTLTSIHSAKGLQWGVVFWADLSRQPPNEAPGGLLLGRERLVIEDPDASVQGPAWAQARLAESLEDKAERKRAWYVAATRAKDRLILGGIPMGAEPAKESPAAALWQRLGPMVEGGEFHYQGREGRFTGLVRVVRAPSVAREGGALVPIGDPAALALPLDPIPVLVGRARHSATEFLAHARCPMKHHFKYVAGVREPELKRSGAEYTGAVARGQIIHTVLERLAEEQELDLLLEDAIRRWDPEAPPPDVAEGAAYRASLDAEIRAVRAHPDYHQVMELPRARRELAFVHLAGSTGFMEGIFDLAAPEGEGMVLLDVKTSDIEASAAPARAAQYVAQRDVYVEAAEAIAGRPVERFAFQFSRAGVQVSEPVTGAVRAAARDRSLTVLATLGQPTLTTHPMECRFCGYREVGWCEGAKR